MKDYYFHPEAQIELYDAEFYYDQAKPGLGSRFESATQFHIDSVRQNPKMYAEEDGGERLTLITPYSYCIVYFDFPDRTWIAAIAHTRRRPGYWRHRKPNDE
ncbi:hypothetical protein BH11PLA2_BH11PLA2_03870 [soil metagenome]